MADDLDEDDLEEQATDENQDDIENSDEMEVQNASEDQDDIEMDQEVDLEETAGRCQRPAGNTSSGYRSHLKQLIKGFTDGEYDIYNTAQFPNWNVSNNCKLYKIYINDLMGQIFVAFYAFSAFYF